MSTVAPIFKRPGAAQHHSTPPPSSDPFQPIPSSILNRRAASPATFLPVQIELSHFRPIAFRIFTKKHNLTLKSDALQVLAEYVGRKCGSEWRIMGEPLLDEIARAWARAEDSNPLVEGGLLVPVLKSLEVPHVARSTSFLLQSSQPNPSLYESQSGEATPTHSSTGIDPINFFSVIDAFTQPKYTFNFPTKTFRLGSKPSIIAAPKDKATLFKERYHIILQRLLRNELFQSYPTHSIPQNATAGKISRIKNLLGRRNQHFLLFGLLTRSPSGVLSLADPDASIPLDLSDAMSAGGIFAPGIFVLADGKYTDREIFKVHTIVLPPSEKREVSKSVYGHVDFLGAREASVKGGIVPVEKEYEKFLVKAERAAGGVRMIFAGELNLDQPRIMKALKKMFEYYSANEDSLPLTFVLMGSFISTPFPQNGFSPTYKSYWDSLADLLSQFPSLTTNCAFVFIPGPNDPWTTSPECLPRRGVPEVFVNRVRRVCKDVRFLSNPCRLNYFTQEFGVVRYDVADTFVRNRIVVKSQVPSDPALDEATLAARDLVKTLLDQSHLTPFSLSLSPTYWSYDHALRLYPLPTGLVMCDTSGWGSFKVTYEGCCVINTGAMLRVDQGDGNGRGRYTGAWWEWDCRSREGREVVVGITEREEGPRKEKGKKERRRKVVEKAALAGAVAKNDGIDERDEGDEPELEEPIPETQAVESQFGGTQVQESRLEGQEESQIKSQTDMEDDGFEDDMLVDV